MEPASWITAIATVVPVFVAIEYVQVTSRILKAQSDPIITFRVDRMPNEVWRAEKPAFISIRPKKA